MLVVLEIHPLHEVTSLFDSENRQVAGRVTSLATDPIATIEELCRRSPAPVVLVLPWPLTLPPRLYLQVNSRPYFWSAIGRQGSALVSIIGEWSDYRGLSSSSRLSLREGIEAGRIELRMVGPKDWMGELDTDGFILTVRLSGWSDSEARTMLARLALLQKEEDSSGP